MVKMKNKLDNATELARIVSILNINSQDKTDRRETVAGQCGLRQNLDVCPDARKGYVTKYSKYGLDNATELARIVSILNINSQDKTDRRETVAGQCGLRQNLDVCPDARKGYVTKYSKYGIDKKEVRAIYERLRMRGYILLKKKHQTEYRRIMKNLMKKELVKIKLKKIKEAMVKWKL
jgi:hypothetical protein